MCDPLAATRSEQLPQQEAVMLHKRMPLAQGCTCGAWQLVREEGVIRGSWSIHRCPGVLAAGQI